MYVTYICQCLKPWHQLRRLGKKHGEAGWLLMKHSTCLEWHLLRFFLLHFSKLKKVNIRRLHVAYSIGFWQVRSWDARGGSLLVSHYNEELFLTLESSYEFITVSYGLRSLIFPLFLGSHMFVLAVVSLWSWRAVHCE